MATHLPKLLSWHRPQFGDSHTSDAYDRRLREAEREIKAPLVVAPDCAFTTEFEGQQRIYNRDAEVPPNALQPFDIERLIGARVLLRASPQRMRALEAERSGAPGLRVVKGKAITVGPVGNTPATVLGEGEPVLPHQVGGESNLRRLVAARLVEEFEPVPPAAA
jgi:hypothetical protein